MNGTTLSGCRATFSANSLGRHQKYKEHKGFGTSAKGRGGKERLEIYTVGLASFFLGSLTLPGVRGYMNL